MRYLLVLFIIMFTNVSSAQIPAETRSIQSSNNREVYYGKRGYVGHSIVRNRVRIFSDKRGVYSRQYTDGSGRTRFTPLRQSFAGEPSRSAASRGFSPKK